jgi:hypothetical protein
MGSAGGAYACPLEQWSSTVSGGSRDSLALGRRANAWWESPGQHLGSNFTHLGTGVHEDKVLAVEPQEDRSRKNYPAHSKHHIHSVAKEGQLACSLWWWRGQDESSAGRQDLPYFAP